MKTLKWIKKTSGNAIAFLSRAQYIARNIIMLLVGILLAVGFTIVLQIINLIMTAMN